MRKNIKNQLFSEYFAEWIELYKVGAVRPITLQKYYNSHKQIQVLAPDLKLKDLTRRSYQQLLNDYAVTHEKQTTMDFHHQVKGAILDAVEDGLIDGNPTRKVIIKGKEPRDKRPKFLNQYEAQALIRELNLGNELNFDWLILLTLKTGLRFSEALAITPNDFDFSTSKLTINKTWDYKSSNGSFQPTKNKSSNRIIQLDWQTSMQFSQLINDYPVEDPIFVNKRVFNSTVNKRLERLCGQAKIANISIHGLRHTHASLLLFSGVSIATVARRLGHATMATTQKTYLHVIQELENKDNDKIMHHLSTLV